LREESALRIQRREFITLAGGAAVSWPLAAHAQQPAKMKRIAMVSVGSKIGDIHSGNRYFRAFFEELSRSGYAEGQNLLVERYSGEGRIDDYAELAHDVISTRPDLIYAMAGPLALQFKMATTTIPIVAISADPIALGLVPSIARPGGNITGISVDAGIQIWGKRLGLLVEATPKLSNARYLATHAISERPSGSAAALREAARDAGISLAVAPMATINEEAYQRAFNLMEQDRVDSLIVSDEAEHIPYREVVTALAAKSRIPSIYPYRAFVEVGGLMAYSIDLVDVQLRCANLVYKILKGDNPGDIPFYQQTKFELIVNLKTAKALGLEIPVALLARADEVIE
jgi:putative tryptophan/tyrosine transport system substrate-binding protein